MWKDEGIGNVEMFRKLRGVQERIPLKLEMRTNNNYSKGIKYMHPESYTI